MALTLKNLARETQTVIATKWRFLLAVSVALFGITAVWSVAFMNPLLAEMAQTPESDALYRFLGAQLLATLVSVVVGIYSVIYITADDSAPALSRARLLRAMKELPNYIVTALCASIRMLPFVALYVGVAAIGIFGVASGASAGAQNTDAMFGIAGVILAIAILPIFWGMAQLYPAMVLTVTTTHRFWSATRLSVRLYKQNRGAFVAAIAPLYAVMIAFLAATFSNPVAASQGELYDSFLWFTPVSLLLYLIYAVLYPALVRRTVDRALLNAA